MLWIWFCPVTTKEFFLKIAAPKRQAKSLKTTCEVVSFYYICKLYTWNLWKTILSQPFLKGFAKIACNFKLYGTVRNLIIYFAETFRCLLLLFYKFITLLLFSLLQMFEQLFSRKTSQRLFHYPFHLEKDICTQYAASYATVIIFMKKFEWIHIR